MEVNFVIDDKYIIFKKEDVQEYMTSGEQYDLETLSLLIKKCRETNGKTSNVFKELMDELNWF